MIDIAAIFKNKVLDDKELINYGFITASDSFTKTVPILQEQFYIEINISADAVSTLFNFVSLKQYWQLPQESCPRKIKYLTVNFAISKLFPKWCSSGVVNAFSLCETIDFTDFSGTFQYPAVADEKYFIIFL